MDPIVFIGGACVIGLLAYLAFALLAPEKLQ